MNFPRLLCAMALLLASSAFAQNKAVRIITFSVGGPIDASARMLAQRLGPVLQTSVIVEPRPGTNGMVAAQAVGTADTDGSTLMVSSSGLLTITPVLGQPAYDPDRDLAPVSRLVVNASAVVLSTAVPAANVREFIEYAKGRREPVAFGSPGIGNIGHLWLEQFNMATGLQIIHVPYKGIAPALTDILGGRIAGTIVDLPAVLQYVKGGQMRLIGMVGNARHPAAPDVPTLQEQGFGGLDLVSWYGVFAPAKTSPATLARLSAAIEKALADPALREQMRGNGTVIAPSSPEELAGIIRSDRQRWAALIKEKNIVVQPN